MKQAALLDGEEKQAAIDEPEELLEIGVLGECAGVEAGAERLVGRMGDEAGAEREQGLGDAGAQALAHALALLLAFLFPRFPRTGIAGCVGRARASGVEEPPDGGEVGVALGAEDEVEIGFEKGGARERIGIAHETELAAVGDDGPGGAGGSVEKLLGELVGGAAAGAGAVDGEAFVGRIEVEAVGGDDDGHAAGAGEGGDWVGAVGENDGLGAGGEVGVAKGIAQQFDDEAGGGARGVDVRAGAGGVEGFAKGGGDAEGAAVLIDESEALGEGVVRGLLRGMFATGGLFEHGGHKEAALQVEGVEDEGVGKTAGHAGGARWWSRAG